MQEEVTQGAVTLIVNGSKMTEQVFEKAVKKFLEEVQKSRQPKIYRGKQTLKQLAGQNAGLANIEISDKNIKAFTHVAKKYGSARWGTPADIAPYMDKDFFNNIPMTQTERITMASRPKQPKYARNKNILVIGGSGSGKTRFFCKPSLLQAHSSYVCTDPKGTLLPEIGSFLERKKYRIKCLNLINFKKSMRYNPLAYIRSEKDILKLVNAPP